MCLWLMGSVCQQPGWEKEGGGRKMQKLRRGCWEAKTEEARKVKEPGRKSGSNSDRGVGQAVAGGVQTKKRAKVANGGERKGAKKKNDLGRLGSALHS